MPLHYIENRTYDEIEVGDSATIARTLKPADSAEARAASCAIALLMANAKRKQRIEQPALA